MRAAAMQRVDLSSDEADRGASSHSRITAQPSPSPSIQLNGSREVGSSSAADASIDLRAPVYELIRCAHRAARDDGSIDVTHDDISEAVRSICTMARTSDIRVETLILAIKAGWRQLPEFRNRARMDAEATLAALITMCIEEYYAPQRRLTRS